VAGFRSEPIRGTYKPIAILSAGRLGHARAQRPRRVGQLTGKGYAATAGDELLRPELCAEAIRPAKLAAALMPDEPEILGLLALMLLHDSRRDARTTRGGDLVRMEDQDRARWDTERIRADEASRRPTPRPQGSPAPPMAPSSATPADQRG
jgi:RNA polymerase sigma-70 factor, ECF subfamily